MLLSTSVIDQAHTNTWFLSGIILSVPAVSATFEFCGQQMWAQAHMSHTLELAIDCACAHTHGRVMSRTQGNVYAAAPNDIMVRRESRVFVASVWLMIMVALLPARS
jgi:hypothetical protein